MATGVETAFVVLLQLTVVLAVAKALGAAAGRLGFTAVVGELLTGFVLGPSVLGLPPPRSSVRSPPHPAARSTPSRCSGCSSFWP